MGLFFGRLAVQVPLYFAGAIGALGVVKIVMGVPLYVAAAYFTYRAAGAGLPRQARARRVPRTQAETQA